jgi:hypothetical protein
MDMEKPPLMIFPRKPRDFPWLKPLGCEESLHGELGTRGYVAPEAGKPVGWFLIVHQFMATEWGR